jgi:hypothetical protein
MRVSPSILGDYVVIDIYVEVTKLLELGYSARPSKAVA